MNEFNWSRFLDRVSFKPGMPVKLRLVSSRDGWRHTDGQYIECTMVVTCVKSGLPTEITNRKPVPWAIRDERDAAGYLRHLVLYAMEHEMDEHMLIDGKHVREPHPENKK